MKRVLVVSVMLFVVGCGLTPEQRSTLLEAEARINQYKPKVAAVIEGLRNGKYLPDEAATLIAEYTENEAADQDLVDGLRSQDIPWWAFVLVGAPTVAGAVGLKKYVGALKVIKGLVLGVEAACDKDEKSTIRKVAVDAGIQPELDAIIDSMGLKKGTSAAPEVVAPNV